MTLAVFAGFGLLGGAFLTSSTTSLVTSSLLPEAAQMQVTWVSWAVRAAVPSLLLLVGLAGTIALLFGRAVRTSPKAAMGASHLDVLAVERSLLGPLTRAERTSAVVAVGLVAAFCAAPALHIDLTWPAVLAVGLLAGLRMLPADALRSLNWSYLMFFGTIASFSRVFDAVGLNQWLGAVVQAEIAPLTHSALGFIIALTVLGLLSSIVLSWSAAATILVVAVMPAAAAAGIDPWVVAFVAAVACNWFLVPSQSTVFLPLRAAAGHLFSFRQARVFALAYAGVLLVALCAAVPVWQLMGLLP